MRNRPIPMAAELSGGIRADGDVPGHVAIVMDPSAHRSGDSAWSPSDARGADADLLLEVVAGALDAGVEMVTLCPRPGVGRRQPGPQASATGRFVRFRLFRERHELRRLGVAVRVLGDLALLDGPTRTAAEAVLSSTRGGSRMRLNLLVSPGGREDIVRAVERLARDVVAGRLAAEEIDACRLSNTLATAELPDPDLLIRTDGEHRLDDSMLWQLAYTEIYVSTVPWPSFSREELFRALLDYRRRERRFGRVGAS